MSEESLRRREFLARTAAAAGMAGAASLLPPDRLLAEASALLAKRSGVLSITPSTAPIDHVVVLMMENRSFDHYFGWMSDVADATQNQSYVDGSGKTWDTFHHSRLYDGTPDEGSDASNQGCGFSDPGHGWDSGRVQMEKGFMAPGSGNDKFALTYFDPGELGFIHDAAKAYTLFDKFHCSLMTSTWPNRYYMWSAQSGGIRNNTPPVSTLGNQWKTIFDVINSQSGLSARYYNSDLPFSAVWGPRAVPWTRPIAEFYAECAAGLLPNVAFVDPPFRDGGGFDGNSADEHPHGDVRLGQAFMADVVNAFVRSPNYRTGALFIVYDEWGGFFDHVRPPVVADDRASAGFGQMGFRIPAVAISPFTRNGTGLTSRVDHGLYGFESILKLISWRWGLGDLNARHAAALNIGNSFNWNAPDFEVPDLPDPVYVASKPCSLGGGSLVPEDVAQHADEMGELEVLADRFGIPVGAGKPSDLFTAPDSVRSAVLSNPA